MVPMTKSRRNYAREFKLDAVKLVVEQGRTVSDVADSLGINRSLLQRWKSQLVAEGLLAFRGNGKVNPHEAELRELRRELNKVRQERDILKKATAYFAREGN
jgi:transposase